MISSPDAAEVQRFRVAIAQRIGLAFRDDQLAYLGEVLGRRLAELGSPVGAYLDQLEGSTGDGRAGDEWERLADDLTVGETFFFRNGNHFQALIAQVVPDLVRSGAPSPGPLRVLSAGCSSGEEPFSLAMALEGCSDALGGFTRTITACDLNAAAIERARQGRYAAWSLRETGDDWRGRFFRASGAHFLLDERIRAQVVFETRNLLADDPGFWRPGIFEMVFCRNMLMYLVPELARALVGKLARSLVPGGYLFLGHAETLRGLSTAFEICNSHETFYYRLPGPERRPPVRRSAAALPASPSFTAALPVPAAALAATTATTATTTATTATTAWIGSIGRSAQRVATLAGAAGRPRGDEAVQGASSAPVGRILDGQLEVVELVRQERYHQAAAVLASLPPEIRREPLSALLLSAVQLQLGEAGRAEATCQALLAAAPEDARCRYVLGLCREQAGDLAAAAAHYRAAAAGAAGFALPHLRLGLLLRRDRQDQPARAAFAQALALIEREDDLHLALFSGGFSRQALAELCRRQAGGGER